MTVSQLINFLNKVEDKNKKVLATLGNHSYYSEVISAESIEISTDGIPAVYLLIDDI